MSSRRHYRCCYINCNARTPDADPAITFFCFPKKNDPKRQQAWVNNSGYEYVESKTLSLVHERICSKHFTADSFTTPANEKLRRTAVPIHYRTKSTVESEDLMPKRSTVAKEYKSSQEFHDMIVEAIAIEVIDEPP